ncbi:MAG TPA: acyltransferase [Candidatus Limnocylindrales bacterium]|nr:acyltransferase [Candidatus Limnocylindrales bacterium]
MSARALRIVAIAVVFKIANLVPIDSLRASLYRLTGVDLGDDVFVGEDVLFDKLNPRGIHIGDRTAIGARTIITAHQVIPTGTDLRTLYPTKHMETVVEHDVWIMPGVIIVPGVTVGHHSVLATGAVIHKDVPPYSLVVGGGFRVAKQLDPASFEIVRDRARTS